MTMKRVVSPQLSLNFTLATTNIQLYLRKIFNVKELMQRVKPQSRKLFNNRVAYLY